MARVLVIERDPLFRDMVQAMLERADHKAQAAVNVSEGLALMLYSRFDVIIADLSMRDMFGRVATTAISQATPVVPIIGMADGRSQQPFTRGPDVVAVIAKPIIEGNLLRVLDQVLNAQPPGSMEDGHGDK
jgi:CheY-like chemotaxis protein